MVLSCANTDGTSGYFALGDKPFNGRFNTLLSQIKFVHKYKRILIDTTDKSDEFLMLLHDAYRHKIAKK